jgi:ABC-type dipeptide/oligopeptide/nickel transport system permease component
MLRYIGMRIVQLVPVLLVMSLVVFFVLYLLPGDPAMVILSGQAALAGPKEVAALRQEMGLNDPVYVQYGRFLLGALQGDLGTSVRFRRPVTEILLEQFPATLQLSLAAMVLAVVTGLSLGIFAAVYRNTAFDILGMIAALLFVSTPIFWSGLMLIFLFAFRLGWFPSAGGSGWRGLVLPAVTLGLTAAGMIARLTRSGLIEIMGQDYIRTARAKGLHRWAIIARHALKNTLIPVITVIGLQFGAMLSGAVITETVFSRPGLGRLTVNAILWKDFRLVQGAIFFTAVCYVLANLIVDVVYAWLDPRIRYES